MDFSMKLRLLLAFEEIAHKKFAAQIGITPQRLSGWLSGRTHPPANLLLKISEILGVSVDILIDSRYKLQVSRVNNENQIKQFAAEPTPQYHPSQAAALAESLKTLTPQQLREVQNFIDEIKKK